MLIFNYFLLEGDKRIMNMASKNIIEKGVDFVWKSNRNHDDETKILLVACTKNWQL